MALFGALEGSYFGFKMETTNRVLSIISEQFRKDVKLVLTEIKLFIWREEK